MGRHEWFRVGAAAQDSALNVSKWQDSLLRMFKETIARTCPLVLHLGCRPSLRMSERSADPLVWRIFAVIDKPQWLHDLATALQEQFKLYPGDHELQV